MRSSLPRLNRLLSSLRVTALQVGARGGLTDELSPIAGAVDATAFEADAHECERLSEDARHDTRGYRTLRYEPLALGPKGRGALKLYAARSWSSLHDIDLQFAKTHARDDLFIAQDEAPVHVVPLDDAAAEANITSAHFLKIAAAAAPLDVLRSGSNVVGTLCALRIGATFAPIYKGQPQFAEIDADVRARGFTLMSLSPLETWRRGTDLRADRWARGATPISEAQPVSAEALYMRRAENFPAATAAEQDQLIAHALISFAYGHLDTCAATLLRPPVRQRVLELCAVDASALLHNLGRWHARRRRSQLGATLARQFGDYLRLFGR